METITLTVWYEERKRVFDIYNLLRQYSFFKPYELYIDGVYDNFDSKAKISEDEIGEKLLCKNGNLPVVISGRGVMLIFSPTITENICYTVSLDIATKVLGKNYNHIEKLFKNLIVATDAFYAKMDMISNNLELLEKEYEDCYIPNKYVQILLWGNYFGGNYANHPNVKKIVESDYCISEKIGDGWFVKLSDDVSGFASEEVKRNRKKLRKFVKSITGHHHIRFKR